jgi:hypothetical protein
VAVVVRWAQPAAKINAAKAGTRIRQPGNVAVRLWGPKSGIIGTHRGSRKESSH